VLDPKWLRTELPIIAQQLARRGFSLDINQVEADEAKRKQLQIDTQQLQNNRNALSKKIGQLKAKGAGSDTEVDALKAQVLSLNEDLLKKENDLKDLQHKIQAYALTIPNIPHPSVPEGKTEEDNQEIRRWGTPKQLAFEPKDHVDLGAAHRRIDLEAGALLAGARFVVLRGMMARLHRALAQFMLDTHLASGYEELYVPYLTHSDCFFGTGQFPKLRDDMFGIEQSDLWLIPTAEVPVTNLCREGIIEAQALPKKWVCHTPSFRREAGSYGKDMRGMMRVHQFDKVELVQIVRPEAAETALEQLTQDAENILQKLNLPYRVLALCAGDMGFSATKTLDLEVWLPGQQRYREVSSCSHFSDFQARRMQARWRNPETGKVEYVHTLNGSGLAVGRTLIAVVENYQDAEGNIHIPEALLPYMGGIRVIERESASA
jgi:seryl-tRNA synthetase